MKECHSIEQVYADHINALSNRIAELEALLREIRPNVVGTLARARIDAALSPERDAKPPSV